MKEAYFIIQQSKLRKAFLEDSLMVPSRGDIFFTDKSIGIVINKKEGIEQNKKKKVRILSKINNQIYAVWHKKDITPFKQTKIVSEAKKLLKVKDKHLLSCYKTSIGETFEIDNLEDLNSDDVEDYLLSHQKEWELIQLNN